MLNLLVEPPVSSNHCPRLYGIFADEAKCDVFWNCWSGEASRYQCSPGLAYDREARVCMWADQVPECKNEGLYMIYWKLITENINPINYFPRRSCKRFRMPSCWWNYKCWIILKTRSSRWLQKILHLSWRCCTWIWLPNWNSFQNWRFWWFRKLWRSWGCSGMVSWFHTFLIQKLHEKKTENLSQNISIPLNSY